MEKVRVKVKPTGELKRGWKRGRRCEGLAVMESLGDGGRERLDEGAGTE